MADDQDILTVKEICELLRVHPSTVYKLLREGKIPGFRIGNEWRFRRDVIMRWMISTVYGNSASEKSHRYRHRWEKSPSSAQVSPPRGPKR